MDELLNNEERDRQIEELKQELEEIQSLLEKPDEGSDNVQVLERSYRQVLVHWIDGSGLTINSISDAETELLQAAQDMNTYGGSSHGDRQVGHGDLMVVESGGCRYIAYVAGVDRLPPYYGGLQSKAPTNAHATSDVSNGQVVRELIVWSTCTGGSGGSGDPCSHDHDVVTITPVVGGTTNVTMPTVTQGNSTNVSVTVPEYTVSTLATNVTITAGTSVDVVKASFVPTTVAATNKTNVLGVTGSPAVIPMLLPSNSSTESIPTGFEVDCSECYLHTDGNYYAADDGNYAPCPNPPTNKTFPVDTTNLTPVYEVGIEVCIGGYPCTLTVLATARTGSGSGCTALSGTPDGYFFPGTPELTIPIYCPTITETGTPVVIPKYWSAQDVVTGITAAGLETCNHTTVNTPAPADKTPAIPSATGTVSVDVPSITSANQTFTSTAIPTFTGGTTIVPMPSVTPGTPVNVSGAKKPCVSGNFNFDADGDGAADTTDAFPNDPTQQ